MQRKDQNVLIRTVLKVIVVLLLSMGISPSWNGVAAQNRGATSDAAYLQEQLVAEPVADLVADVERFGDPRRGARTFYEPTMNCVKCHLTESAAKTARRQLGPPLAVQRAVTAEHLIESILYPSKKIREGFESVLAQTIEGQLMSGVLVEETATELVIDRIEQPLQPLTLLKEDLDDWRKTAKSSMPEQLVNQLTDRQQFLDLVSYLVEIAREGPEREQQLRPHASMFAMAPLPAYESRIDHAGLMVASSNASLERGAETYRLRCASCHGTANQPGSMPTSLRFASGRFKHGNDPFTMYKTLTHGYGMMNAQRWMVPQEKYDVIHYIRERIVRPNNRDEYFELTQSYLDELPLGDTRGPAPVVRRPWTEMDYGPSLNNTIEITRDGSNIAQKGIAIRMDEGPGGVASGKHWALYDHDTMRVAGVWSGNFLDYNGIHFNGVHGRHPRIAGHLNYSNLVGPGWGRPDDLSFADERIEGRDGKRYGPLPRSWLHFRGLYRYGRRTILSYRVGDVAVLESPSLRHVDGQPVIERHLNLAPHDEDMVVQVAHLPRAIDFHSSDGLTVATGNETASESNDPKNLARWDGEHFWQTEAGETSKVTSNGFTVHARIKSDGDGTIVSQTRDQKKWVPGGRSFFVRSGRLHFDIGWVGVVSSDRDIPLDRWTDVAMSWDANSQHARFFVNGNPAGGGVLGEAPPLTQSVWRIGYTNTDFPESSGLTGQIQSVRLFSRTLRAEEIQEVDAVQRGVVWHWPPEATSGDAARGLDDSRRWRWESSGNGMTPLSAAQNLMAQVSLTKNQGQWLSTDDGNLRLKIFGSKKPLSFVIRTSSVTPGESLEKQSMRLKVGQGRPLELQALIRGGPANWSQKLVTDVVAGHEEGPFQVDVFRRPTDNPWKDRLRLTGLDFLPDGNVAIVSTWDGSIWRVSGIGEATTQPRPQVTWQRIAAGLFQPLGVRVVSGKIFVICRDQLVRLHDLNGDGEMDWYENFNNDHQVTEHFHEFAMGLQTDAEGNFYYAKSARHALPAVVPHHGTLLKVTADGQKTEILATGFRAANGVCLNPDGSFIVTDQEGHWNPKNRINWVRRNGFYGNMFGYHNVQDESDDAMQPPLCWITNAFDRSPAELLWVTSERWKPLQGSLLNFSYGHGKIFVVPHQQLEDRVQGGMCALDLQKFPTGIMRGRFHPDDGQLYCCGMFAWAGNQEQPGGMYRIRYTGQDVHLPIELNAYEGQVEIKFAAPIDPRSAIDPKNFRIQTWDLKRTKNYGSKHFNQKKMVVERVMVSEDATSVTLFIPNLKPTWGMEIVYALRTATGRKFQGKIHNTIHVLPEPNGEALLNSQK